MQLFYSYLAAPPAKSFIMFLYMAVDIYKLSQAGCNCTTAIMFWPFHRRHRVRLILCYGRQNAFISQIRFQIRF
jgi:hypothetical protein